MVVFTFRDILLIVIIVAVLLLLGGAWILDKISNWRRRRKASK